MRTLTRSGGRTLLAVLILAVALLAAGCGKGEEETPPAQLPARGATPGARAPGATPPVRPGAPAAPAPTAGAPATAPAAPTSSAPGEIPELLTPVAPELAAQRMEAFRVIYGPFEREEVKAWDGETLEFAVFSQVFCSYDGASHPPGTADCRVCGRALPKQTGRVRLPLSFITDMTTQAGMKNLYRIFPFYPGPAVRQVRARPRATRVRASGSTRPIPEEWPSPVL